MARKSILVTTVKDDILFCLAVYERGKILSKAHNWSDLISLGERKSLETNNVTSANLIHCCRF